MQVLTDAHLATPNKSRPARKR